MDIILTQRFEFISFPISFPSRFLTDHLVFFDGSGAAVEELARRGLNVTLIVRKGQQGLASAVVEGLRMARGDIAVVMDDDRGSRLGAQHPDADRRCRGA